MEFVLDGYCGLYCGACPNMLGTKSGLGNNPCHGCKSEQPTGYCSICEIKACASGRGYDFCSQCGDFCACELLQKFVMDVKEWPHQQCVIKNMDTIRTKGKEKWLETQDKRWRCAYCGTSHSWFAETCSQCGKAVASYKADITLLR
jgi:hypothetical protein